VRTFIVDNGEFPTRDQTAHCRSACSGCPESWPNVSWAPYCLTQTALNWQSRTARRVVVFIHH